MSADARVVHDSEDQWTRRIVVNGIQRGELTYNSSGQALIRTAVPVSCSSATLRAIADLLDNLGDPR